MINSADLVQIMLANTIGISILAETMKAASFLFTHTNGHSAKKLQEARACFAFIKGTGMELIIEDYGLGYDADRLRYSFYDYFKLRKYLD